MKQPSLWLGLLVLAVYLALPTRTYYWDGVAYALLVERPEGFGGTRLTANHLLYAVVGAAWHQGISAVVLTARALHTLQGLSSVCGAVAVALLYRLLARVTDGRAAAALSLLVAFSATWWRFATDAAPYVPCTLFLVLAFGWLTQERPRWLWAALAHTAAMLLHSLGVLFTPVAVWALWRGSQGRGRWVTVLAYLAVASGLTLGSYVVGYRVATGRADVGGFVAWVTSHSPDAQFSMDAGRGLAVSARGHLRLLLGGRLRLALEAGWPTLAWGVAVGAMVAVVLSRVPREATPKRGDWLRLALAWAVPYAAFLVVWLPQNTFYRILYVPALALGVAEVSRGTRHRLLVGAACGVAAWNGAASLYPLSRPALHEPLREARRMDGVWGERTVVYYGAFHTDNWLACYLHRQTRWKEVHAEIDRELVARRGEGWDFWIDGSGAERLGPEWMRRHAGEAVGRFRRVR